MTYNDRMTLLARLGFAARGLVYLLVGWFALDAARQGSRPSDNQGAMATLVDAPFGKVLLALCALGFAGYAFWRLMQAAVDPEGRSKSTRGRFERAGYAISGITHLVLMVLAAKLALRESPATTGAPGDESAQSWSAWLLEQPGGEALLIAAGVLLIVVAGAQAFKAYSAKFDDLSIDVPAPRYVHWIGRLGYAARAVIFAMVGWFVISAARNNNAEEAGGLGRALRELQAQEHGAWMLGIVAVGLALFGVFSLIEARFRRVNVPKAHI
ncbi:MAG: DUF1206 domain-containing protein [Sphingobium sp.]|uniref:DUF1206 domain-containing protein n=1 Tax=Sphingobium sp. TaxID=1912891 RepID=UPI0029B00B53|nr:DUF1206 domain-containing protein [Sphingobium sp.]MDX3909765.1 DUF1206 domain-containing protein [Sphingobium sp.]